jgi:hypothetical protein
MNNAQARHELLMSRKAIRGHWTHTATVAVNHRIGPWQFGDTIQPGDVVEVWQDPTLQEGGLISIRKGHNTGAVPINDLIDYKSKDGN